jgi:hypothetical protein
MGSEEDPIKPDEANLRGQAVEMFARLERALDTVIASYYVTRQPLQTYFVRDLLSSELFSYGLRRAVFESIARRYGWHEEKRMQHLRKAGHWRNFLAHVAGIETHVYSGNEDTPRKVGYQDPKTPDDVLTVQEAFECFKPECENAHAYVSEVIGKIVPMDKFMRPGHVVEGPIAPEETFEDWLKAPRKPDV